MIPAIPNNFAIVVEKQGPDRINKESFPLRYGKYSVIRTPDFEFIFNLNGEIKTIRGLNSNWPHPSEKLKRTDGNDWVYYSVGDISGDKGIISWFGEYYLPCLPYPSNPIWEINYFSNPEIMKAFGAWPQLYADLYSSKDGNRPPKANALISKILENNDTVLHERSKSLHEIIGGPVSVLPPDTRHVDYEIIPLNISDGCLYHCKFCCVQSEQRFKARPKTDIENQIEQLREFYGRNLENYNGLFLGDHDTLAAGEELLLFSASKAYEKFGFESRAHPPSLFLFGSVDSLLKSKNQLFEKLNDLPFYMYINIGLESVDKQTLKLIGKPLSKSKVKEAFKKILHINSNYKNIEVTGNFVIGEGLSDQHYESLIELLQNTPKMPADKGAIYLSPLKDSPKKRELLPLINTIQEQSKMPVYIYLIQRL